MSLHGESYINGKPSAEYKAWQSMKSRCLAPGTRKYGLYGGRGIGVCDRWLDSFENFLEDMGRKPGAGYSLGRIDGDGDYSPNNCRWESHTEQNLNRSNSITNEMVSEVQYYKSLGLSHSVIADLVGISAASVSHISTRKYKRYEVG